MKRSAGLCIAFLFVVAFFAFGSISQEAKAFTMITLQAPADSSKVTTGTPTFQWTASGPSTEKPRRFQIQLATDPNFNTIVWDDTNTAGTARSRIYDGATPLVDWTAYFWRMRVQVDSSRVAQGDTITYWQEDFSAMRAFFYGTETCIDIPADLPTIQNGIYWAKARDTVLVEPGVYYENLRFHKDSILVASHYLLDQDTATIKSTIIDGSKLSRGAGKGSVVFFSAGVDSFSTLMGFTLTGGTGTEMDMGTEKKFNGGGIVCDLGSCPNIKYNIITGNTTQHDGGGIFLNAAVPNITDNIITNNTAIEGSGGGIECRFSIEIQLSPGKKGDDRGADDDFSSTPTLQSDVSQEEIEDALNPKDATQVNPVNAPPVLAKPTQNTPPVAIINWYARKNTIIERDKYLPGDTLFFDGSDSYDPDGGDDSIAYWAWWRNEYYRCNRNPSTSYSTFNTQREFFLPITETSRHGILKVYLEVRDTTGIYGRGLSADTLEISVQYPPYVDAGSSFRKSPGQTVWLDGSASCDVNPTDVLQYTWTQKSGPSVTIENADADSAYFIPPDDSYNGFYEFQLKVSDGTVEDSATVTGTISNPPVPICKNDPVFGDTLHGNWTKDSTIWLDGCESYDPDAGDEIKKYLWISAGRWELTKTGWVKQVLPSDSSNNCLEPFSYFFGGLWKFYLYVRDSYEIVSPQYDSVLYSIQLPPSADAGRDTVFKTGVPAWRKGRAIDSNPEQRAGMKYQWFVDESPGGNPVSLSPSPKSDSISFTPSASGKYILSLQVDDGMDVSTLDEVTFMANRIPEARVDDVTSCMEGDTIYLSAARSIDPDSATYGKVLSFAWSLKSKPADAAIPEIVNPDQVIAKFVPYTTGTYEFRVVVHDTLSKKQPVDSSATGNITFLTVEVDSTYSYPFIKNNLIAFNYSGSRGGGIDCNESSPDIFNNILYGNVCKYSGGGICARNFSTPQIKDNILFRNVSENSTGGAIADLKGNLAPSATRGYRRYVTVQNNDFWDNTGGDMYQITGTIVDNIYDYPRLVDPEFGDFTLECSSPCLTKEIGVLPLFSPCDNLDHLGMVSLSMFQNPAATAAAHFVVNTDAPLKGEPVAYVTIGSKAPSPVYFTPVSTQCFRGSFVFTSSGDAKICVLASSVLEIDTTFCEDFSVQFVPADLTETLSSFDQMVKLTFPQGSAKQDIYATCISAFGDSQYDFNGDTELETIGEPYQLGPAIPFQKDLTIRFSLDDFDLGEKNKALFSVYRYTQEKWERVDSYLEGNSVCADVRDLGVYRLIYDPTGKYITSRPTRYALQQNYPNPFNPETQIRYDLPLSGFINLSVYNVLGQRVRTLVDEFQEVGRKSVIWDGRDDSGHQVASGIYFYKLKAENFEKTRKMILIK